MIFLPLVFAADLHHTSKLYGNSDLGYYYVNIYVGTPPIKQSVIVDTGSGLTTFPCKSCQNCGDHEDDNFDQDKSISFNQFDCNQKVGNAKCQQCQNGQCKFGISYAEGSSLRGYYLKDKVLFGDHLYEQYLESDQEEQNKLLQQEQVDLLFGCTTEETNLFYTQLANGILGLGVKTNSQNIFPNIVDQLKNQEPMFDFTFTLCIGRLNGYMTLGGYNFHRHIENASYHQINYYTRQGFDQYSIEIKSVKLQGSEILSYNQLNVGKGSFLDSGSTLLNADTQIANKFLSNFKCTGDYCSREEQIDSLPCYKFDIKKQTFEQFSQQFPTYEFILENNFTMYWTPQNYLTKALQQHDMYCLPVLRHDGGSAMILGQVWMRNWDIAFNKSQKTVSFVQSNCSDVFDHFHDYEKLLQEGEEREEGEEGEEGEEKDVDEQVQEAIIENNQENNQSNQSEQHKINLQTEDQQTIKKTNKRLNQTGQNITLIIIVLISLGILIRTIYILVKRRNNKYINVEEENNDII